MCWAEVPTNTEDCPQCLWTHCDYSSWILSKDRFTPHPHNEWKRCWAHPSSSMQSSCWNLTVQTLCLCTTFISPQFGLLHSPPSHHCSCRYISTKTSFTEVISLKLGICIVLWAEDLCQQHKQEIFLVSWVGSVCWELQGLISSLGFF